MSAPSRAFEARFDGWCANCPEDVKAGDRVLYDHTNRLVHETCPDEQPEPRVGDVCPDCFTTKALNGTCGC